MLLCACTERAPVTMEEAMNMSYRVRIGNVDFDMPVNFNSWDYRATGQWSRPSRVRERVDYLRFNALLSDMAPYTEDNAAEYNRPGWGSRVQISMTDREKVDWVYYFNMVGPRLRQTTEPPDLPGMIHYVEVDTGDDVYLSHDHPTSNLVRVDCRYAGAVPFPSCKVTTRYRNGEFHLEYAFAREHIGDWREIDRKVKALLDRFADAARQHP
jgi:hypothetical protein